MNKKDLFLNRENVKKFSLENVQMFLEDSKLKDILGGSGGSGDAGDKLCYRYCYTMGWPERTMWSYSPSCYDHYHFCNQRGEVADCTCWKPGM